MEVITLQGMLGKDNKSPIYVCWLEYMMAFGCKAHSSDERVLTVQQKGTHTVWQEGGLSMTPSVRMLTNLDIIVKPATTIKWLGPQIRACRPWWLHSTQAWCKSQAKQPALSRLGPINTACQAGHLSPGCRSIWPPYYCMPPWARVTIMWVEGEMDPHKIPPQVWHPGCNLPSSVPRREVV